MKHILIVDDDVYIGNMLQDSLKREHYLVSQAYSGTEALLFLEHQRPDLILLDLMLPGLSGEEILPKIKGIPVIVISAKVDVKDKVALLLGGAVDYVTKPFYMEELLARISVQLRKASAADKASKNSILTFHSLKMDFSSHSVSIQDQIVKLTRTEYSILKLLLQNPTQVLTKAQILEQISQETPDCVESSLKVHVSNLRRKLREVDNYDYIESVWGIGFKLREE